MSRKILQSFIRCINEHDVEGMLGLMHRDHLFVDALGTEARGRYLLKNAWTEYFEWFPDYQLIVEEIYSRKERFVVLGFASGTYRGRKTRESTWMLPAAWRAVIRDGKVREWQVYCDTKTVSEIMKR